MAEVAFTPTTVERKAKNLILHDETGSRLTLRMPNKPCAAIVYAALLHNLPTGDAA